MVISIGSNYSRKAAVRVQSAIAVVSSVAAVNLNSKLVATWWIDAKPDDVECRANCHVTLTRKECQASTLVCTFSLHLPNIGLITPSVFVFVVVVFFIPKLLFPKCNCITTRALLPGH